MMPDEKATSAAAFLSQAVAFFKHHRIQVRSVMTDNGPCFCSDRFRDTYTDFQMRHLRTRFYTPQTNGKAERFIQTALREWAYAQLYQHSEERKQYLSNWIHTYNWHRPHASLNQMPPISRAGLDDNNLLRHHKFDIPPDCRFELESLALVLHSPFKTADEIVARFQVVHGRLVNQA